MQKALIFILGITIGVALTFFLKIPDKQYRYIELLKPYAVDTVGQLKAGTILRIDQPMSEGFTRYILYLNLKGGEYRLVPNMQKDRVRPYWMKSMDK